MNICKRLFVLTVCLAIATACSLLSLLENVDRVDLTPQDFTMAVGDDRSVTATATFTGFGIRTEEVTSTAQWSSDIPAVATVSLGQVTAVSLGTAVVTATFQGVSGTAFLTVTGDGAVPDDGAVASEGSIGSPVSIGNATGGTVTYSGAANISSSYYVVTVSSGTIYTVTMSGLTSNLDLRLYTGSTFTGSIDTSLSGGTTSESVTGTATSSSLYIEADPYLSVGSTFTLTVTIVSTPGGGVDVGIQ